MSTREEKSFNSIYFFFVFSTTTCFSYHLLNEHLLFTAHKLDAQRTKCETIFQYIHTSIKYWYNYVFLVFVFNIKKSHFRPYRSFLTMISSTIEEDGFEWSVKEWGCFGLFNCCSIVSLLVGFSLNLSLISEWRTCGFQCFCN